jgi:hypothetical protein
MHTLKRSLQRCALIASTLAIVIGAHAAPIKITVDTSSLLGTDGVVAFDFTDGTSAANTATITNFEPSASLDSSIFSSTFGDVSGDLTTTLTLGPSGASFLEGITFGSSISFIFDTDGLPVVNPVTEFPDGLVFTLYDVDGFTPILSEDATGALLVYSIGEAEPFTVLSSFVEQAPVSEVPEPVSLALVGAAWLSLALVRLFKR